MVSYEKSKVNKEDNFKRNSCWWEMKEMEKKMVAHVVEWLWEEMFEEHRGGLEICVHGHDR